MNNATRRLARKLSAGDNFALGPNPADWKLKDALLGKAA